MDHTATLAPGRRVLADIVVSTSGKVSREMVRVERILDQETVLVTVESSLSTPDMIRGLTLPIMASRIAR